MNVFNFRFQVVQRYFVVQYSDMFLSNISIYI